jgi:hypothetical protein
MLQRAVDNGIEDCNRLMEGNKSLLAERNDFQYRFEDLQVELREAHFDAKKQITNLEARVRSAEAQSVDVTAAGEKHLKDFEDELIQDLAELSALYVRNTQIIGGLCSLIPKGEPSTTDYLRWLST